MHKLKVGLAALLLGLILIFVVQNLGSAKIRFLTWKWNLPVAIPVIFAYAVGGLSGRWVFRFLNARRVERQQVNVAKKAVKDEKAKSPELS